MTFWKAVYVHVCAHAYYVCLHLSKQIGFLKKPHRMTECSLVLSPNSSPCPIFLSSPSLSLFFLSPIPPLTQLFFKVNPRGIFSAATFWLYLLCLWPCSWVLVLGQCWEMAALVTGPTRLASLISVYFLRLVLEILACFLRLIFVLVLPPKADFWQTRLFELRVFCGQ